MPESLLTVPEVERQLGVSRSTVWRLIQRGELPSIRRAGRRLVPAASLRARRPARPAEIPPLTTAHPIFRLVGAGRGGGRKPGARDKHVILDQ
jgi:excisionase family DNA binding protein